MWHLERPKTPTKSPGRQKLFVFFCLVWRLLQSVPSHWPIGWRSAVLWLHQHLLVSHCVYEQGHELWFVRVRLVALPVSRPSRCTNLWCYDQLIWHGDNGERRKHHGVWSWFNPVDWNRSDLECYSDFKVRNHLRWSWTVISWEPSNYKPLSL